ncbi:MAG: hypothetical protein IPH35_18720 [Rhodoferax sp.]|nr:hypothetical protein [Rhodoferax sp.]
MTDKTVDRATVADKTPTGDASNLRQQASAWREKAVSSELTHGILRMQSALDKLPQRSLHLQWQVLINHGVFGCETTATVIEGTIEFTDPCNQNRYTGDGHAVNACYPSLAIPPYTI